MTGQNVDETMNNIAEITKRLSKPIRFSDRLPIKKYANNLSMKVVFIGPDKTGTKTSFIKRFATGTFSESPQKYLTKPEVKKVKINGAAINISLIDAPGNEKAFASHLKRSSAAVVGYDPTSKQSFDNACKVCSTLKEKNEGLVVMAVGGMADREYGRLISSSDAEKYFKSFGADLYFEG